MKKTTAMVSARLCERSSRLLDSLHSAIEHFRNGEDHSGLNSFLTSVDDLEIMLDTYQCLGKPKIELEKLFPAVQKLYLCMQNQDIIGITDLLEFTLYPLAESWLEECAEN